MYFVKKICLYMQTLVDPTLNNFFGFGNETVYDKTKGIDYYRVRYKYIEGRCVVTKKVRCNNSGNGRPGYLSLLE